MRIAHVAPYFPPHVGGQETLVYEVSKWQAYLGNDVYVLTSNRSILRKSEEVLDKIHVIRLPTLEVLQRPIFNPLFQLARIKPDVIVLYNPSPFADFQSYLSSKILRKCFIAVYVADAILDNVSFNSFLNTMIADFFNHLSIKILKRAKVVISLTKGYIKESKYLNLVDPRKIRVIHQGTNPERFRPSRGTNDLRKKWGLAGKKVVLFVGRLVPYKGVSYLLQGFKLAYDSSPGLRLVIAGEGPLKEDLIKKSHELGIANVVLFPGFVSDKKLPLLLNLADVVICPSINKSEHVPIVALDAMACGKPVVVSDVGGAKDQVKHSRTGLLIKPKDPKEIQKAISFLIRNPELTRSISKEARQYAESISWLNIAKEHLRIYKQCARMSL